jgi:hypothetical protein
MIVLDEPAHPLSIESPPLIIWMHVSTEKGLDKGEELD